MAKNDFKETTSPVLADSQQTGGPTATQLEQAEMLFSEIASQACLIDDLCCYGATEEDEVACYATQMSVVRQMVQRIGWMADKGWGRAVAGASSLRSNPWALKQFCTS
jgi:hypothetical protein